MSVLVIDTQVINQIYKKLESYQFNKVCDIDYCYTASRAFERLGEDSVKNMLKTLADLNEISYSIKYRENIDGPMLSELITFRSLEPTINTYQCLKYLQCIRYNIEVTTIKELRSLTDDEKNALNFLHELIDDIKSTIISQLPEYKAANWA